MKNAYPSRENNRWEHALTRPLTRRTKFELLELMRADLFEYLDVLTADLYNSKKDRAIRDAEIQRIADRLKELTPLRAEALGVALKTRRLEYVPFPDTEAAHCPQSGPMDTGAQIRVAIPALAHPDSIAVAAPALHDAQLAELGATFRDSSHFVERPRRRAPTEP
jgi:hypothetical protein